MKLKLLAVVLSVCVLLSGCARVVRSQKDEIRLYSWAGEFENGNKIELIFDDSFACFFVKNSDFSLKIRGLCSLTDEDFVILNEENGVGYSFSYDLHGDCVDLSYHGDSITLEKIVEK